MIEMTKTSRFEIAGPWVLGSSLSERPRMTALIIETTQNIDEYCPGFIHAGVILGRAVRRGPEDPAICGCWQRHRPMRLAAVSIIKIAAPWVLGSSASPRPRMTTVIVEMKENNYTNYLCL